jgi:hypothetical protein
LQASVAAPLNKGGHILKSYGTAARKWWRNIKAIASADLVAELRAINSKIDALDYHSHGARAVYVCNNRVLMIVAGAQIAFRGG